MLEPLSLLVRKGKLPSPIRRNFNRVEWDVAYSALPREEATETFYNSAMWFADQLEAVHRKIAALKLGRLDREALKREFCGRCNYGYAFSEAHLRLAIEQAEAGDLPMGSPGHILFKTHTGDTGNADAMRTGATDSLSAALRYLDAEGRDRARPAIGVAKAAEAAFSLFNRLYVLEFYCDKMIWQGWQVVLEGDAWRVSPPDPDPFGVSAIAVDWRRDQDHGEWTTTTSLAWREGRGFPERVVVRDAKSGRFSTRLRLAGSGDISPQAVFRWIIDASDLEDVIHRPLPHFVKFKTTLSDLIDAALLIGSAARLLTDDLLALGPNAPVKRFAPTFPPGELEALLAELGWSAQKCAAVVEFFTYRGEAIDGVWSKPLVASRWGLMPILPAIVSPNLYRSAEIWLAEAGGETLQSDRGGAFEIRARRALKEALKRAKLDHIVQVAPPFTVKIDGARRDIDLAFRIDHTVFVGEDKLKRVPAAPRESGRWIDELTKGAGQAKLRCEHFARDPAAIAQHTGFSGNTIDLRFVPFVLASGSFGAGCAIDGVPVLDFEAMIEFFDPGYYPISGELKPGSEIVPTRVIPLRDETLGLAACFEAYLKAPVRVRVIEAAMVPLERKIGLTAVDGRAILCTDPKVDHRCFTAAQNDWRDEQATRIWREALAKHGAKVDD